MSDAPRYPNPPLSDGVIRLRAWETRNADAVEKASQDPYIPSVTSVPTTYTDVEGRAFIGRQAERLRTGMGLSLCIADAVTYVALGFIGLLLNGPDTGRSEIGY